MPKRSDIRSILIIGAGPIIIGQACEFDYSGAQACKALKAEGFRVILVNSNPATIMTDPEMADATYIEPVTWQTVAKIIEAEKPDALLPTMGGQVALNCALDLYKHGVLAEHGVELIGASRDAIDLAEDREKFRNAMTEIGLESPSSGLAHSWEEARELQRHVVARGVAVAHVEAQPVARAHFRVDREPAWRALGHAAEARHAVEVVHALGLRPHEPDHLPDEPLAAAAALVASVGTLGRGRAQPDE